MYAKRLQNGLRATNMAILNFNTTNQTFNNLLGNNVKFKVPPFQRDYSWGEDEWDDLWQDVIELLNGNEDASHYMGYLVLQSSDSKEYSIIDGQQRLTTLSIIILSGLSFLDLLINENIDTDNNKRRKEEFLKNYIGYVDPVTLATYSKLELNRHNNNFYQTYLVPLEKLPQRNLNASEHRLRKAFIWFHDKFKTHIGVKAEGGKEFAKTLVLLVEKIFFTTITVTDELNAFRVFETLNARGVRLSSTDLLKNYLFSLIETSSLHNNEFKFLEDRWERITGVLGAEAFPEFLRIYWNSKNKLVRKADLFKVIKRNLTTRDKAFELIKELDQCSEIYASLRDPMDSRWNLEEKKAISQLLMFKVRQPLAMLISCYRKFFDSDRKAFTKIIRSISILSFRYNVICNMKTYEQEKLYSDLAIKVSSNDLDSHISVIDNLKVIYPDDDTFCAIFSDKELRTTSSRNKKVARYILFEMESFVSKNNFNFESPEYTIEHVLPENVSSGWDAFDETMHSKMVYRLGNMTLLRNHTNRDIGNSSFQKKTINFANSEFSITKSINQHYSEWTSSTITLRQSHMAKHACQIWRL